MMPSHSTSSTSQPSARIPTAHPPSITSHMHKKQFKILNTFFITCR